MTYIVIHHSPKTQNEALLKLLNRLKGENIESVEQHFKSADIHIVGEGTDAIGIEDVKKLQKDMMYKPFDGGSQFAIILNSQKLTHQAQNALLKTLEESPDHSNYILVVNNEKNLLDTIISRGTKIYSESIEQALETSQKEYSNILELDLVDAFSMIEQVIKQGEIADMLDSLLGIFRKSLKKEMGKGSDTSEIRESIQHIQKAKERISANGNKRLTLESLILHLHKN